MIIGCKTRGTGEGASYQGSHGQTVRVERSVSEGKNLVHQAISCLEVYVVWTQDWCGL